MIFRQLYGDDIFISYSRRDASLYAAGLADELTKRSFSCFIDQLGTDPDRDLPATLTRKLSSCTVCVLVCSSGALASNAVAKEIAHFRKTKRTIIPVQFAGAQEESELWSLIPGLARAEENAEALATGQASGHVVERVAKSFRYLKRNERLRRIAMSTGVAVLVLLCAGVAAGFYALHQLNQATLAQTEATESRKEADKQLALARNATTEAARQKKIAEEQAKETRRQEKLAEERQQVAFSRELASNSIGQLNLDPELGVLLAREAVKTSRTAEAEQALRQSLASHRARAVIAGHRGPVTTALLSPDGRSALTVTGEDGARIWNAATGSKAVDLPPFAAKTLCADFGPDSASVVAGHADGTIRVWNFMNGTAPKVLRGHKGAIHDVAFSADGKRIASASADGTARVWELTGESRTLVIGAGEGVEMRRVLFSDGGEMVTALAGDGALYHWSVRTGKELKAIALRSGDIAEVAVSPDGKFAVFATSSGEAEAVELKTGERRELGGYFHPIATVAFSPDNKLATAGPAVWLRIWPTLLDPEAPVREIGKDRTGAGAHAVRLAFSGTGKLLASVDENDSRAQIWDVETGERLAELRGHTAPISRVAFSSGTNMVVTSAGDGTVRVWDVNRGAGITRLPEGAIIDEAIFSPDGGRAVTPKNGMRMEVSVINTHTGAILRTVGGSDSSFTAQYSPDGRLLAGESGRSIKIWDSESGALVRELKEHADDVVAYSFSSDGRRLVSASKDRTARVWTISTGGYVELKGHAGPVRSAVFSANRVFTAAEDGAVLVWDASSGERLKRLDAGRALRHVAVSSDGARAIATAEQGTVHIWDVASGQRRDLSHADSGVFSAGFSPDDRFVLGVGRQPRVWEAATGKELKFGPKVKAFESAVFTPDGRYLISVDGTDMVRLWNAQTAQLVTESRTLIGKVKYVSVSPSGGAFLIHDGDRTAYVYPWESIAPAEDLLGVSSRAIVRKFAPLEARLFLHR